MQEMYRKFRALAAEDKFEELKNLNVEVKESFNWVRDVFEGINVADHPDETALIWTDGNHKENYSFQRLMNESNSMLNFMRKHGIEKGDVVGFQMPLLPANWMTMLSGIKGGFRLIPIATILGVHDLVYRFGKLMPKIMLADKENVEKIDDAEKLCGQTIKLKIIVDGEREGWYSLEDVYKESTNAEAAETKLDDPLFLFFTSGTTGMPKIVTHTHKSYPVGHLTTASWIGLRQGDIHYNISQPGWAKFAWSSFFAPWNVGATIFAYHSTERFNAQETLQLMVDNGVTTFCSPPTVLRMLIQQDLKAYDLKIRQCVSAGEPLNPEVIEAWKKGTGTLIRDGYGQTESTCLVANIPGTEVKYGSMGKPTFLYDIVIADDEGNELPIDEEGNITVRTNTGIPNGIFDEYFGEPEKKAKVFKNDLYYTGDKAYKDADGYFWFVGRDDDVIKSSDYRIGPFEVESVLLEHPAVLESAVVGTPHPVKGYEVKAFVVLSGDYQADEELAHEIFAFSRKNIAPFKMPRVIEFTEELPKTISGKIKRIELRAAEAEAKAKKTVIEHEYFYKK